MSFERVWPGIVAVLGMCYGIVYLAQKPDSYEKRIQTTVELMEKQWGNQATVYRKGGRIAVIKESDKNDGTFYVSEFELHKDLSVKTIHFGIVCPIVGTPMSPEKKP